MLEKTIYVEGTYEKLLRRVDELEAKLRKAGFRVPNSSRLGSYRRILKKAQQVADSVESSIDYRLLHQAIFECNQLLLIVDELEREPEVLGWRPKVQELLSGHDVPEAEGVHTPGRNTQFELFVAGVCRRAGYSVSLVEPDVVIEASDLRLGLAAKRLKSPSKLPRNLRSASNQLGRAALSGFIALDLSIPLAFRGIPWRAGDLAEAKLECGVILMRFIHENQARIGSSVDRGHAFGLLAFLPGLFAFEERDMLAVVTVCRAVNLCSEHDLRCKQIATFADTIGEISLE